MTHRVIQWSTGNVGRLSLRSILLHPDLELAGLWVHSADKVGLDAAELAGLPEASGVLATNDADALLATEADVVMYTATGDLRPHEAVADMCRILEAGKHVVSTSVVSLLYPPAGDRGMVERLTAACERGRTACFTSGIDPGWANDLIPLAFTGLCERVDAVRIVENLDYSTYMQPEVLFGTMGFGQPLDHTPLLLFPGALSFAWGGVVHMIAAGLGVELDDVREVVERRAAERDHHSAVGLVPAGSMAGLRFEVQGWVHGRPAIVVEHVTRMHPEVAPDWPQPKGGGSYRVQVDGSPSYAVEIEITGEDGDHNTGGLVGTGMRLLNAIPAVCAAPPGLLSTLDLPLVTGRHLLS
ncbi:MAG: diacylglycerol kinase [Actinobacteria bacterium]|nr:diacylglycerol kinase [Actinomycetota bacterium]